MRTMKCKQCDSRMWEDEDGSVYCPNCGWEVGTPVELLDEFDRFDSYDTDE